MVRWKELGIQLYSLRIIRNFTVSAGVILGPLVHLLLPLVRLPPPSPLLARIFRLFRTTVYISYLQSSPKLVYFPGDEFFQRVVHRLVTDFIVQMPSKLKELRNRADESARILLMCLQEGREPPPAVAASGKEFQSFLQLIGEFYSKDPLNLELCLEFWCPSQGV